ncbi:signal peptide peptidase [Hamiltosporidium magnivora]|nr:signal peptide peptidase [Hamiltosporidium magnivora]
MKVIPIIILYVFSILVVYASTCQKRNYKEYLNVYNAISLPILASLALFMTYICLKVVKVYFMNVILATIFSFLSFFSLISNFELFYRFAKVKILGKKPQPIPVNDGNTTIVSILYEDQIMINTSCTPLTSFEESNSDQNSGYFLKKYYNNILEWYSNLTFMKLLCISISMMLCLLYVLSTHWILINIMTISVMFQTIRNIGLDSTRTGIFILLALFLYDVVWVFSGNVMETVSEKIQIPVKIVVPNEKNTFTIIGLGDLFIPGLFLSMIRNFSIRQKKIGIYWFTLLGYSLGLGIAICFMVLFKKSQPALMYICPLLLLTSFTYSLYLNMFKDFLIYKQNNTFYEIEN